MLNISLLLHFWIFWNDQAVFVCVCPVSHSPTPHISESLQYKPRKISHGSQVSMNYLGAWRPFHTKPSLPYSVSSFCYIFSRATASASIQRTFINPNARLVVPHLTIPQRLAKRKRQLQAELFAWICLAFKWTNSNGRLSTSVLETVTYSCPFSEA